MKQLAPHILQRVYLLFGFFLLIGAVVLVRIMVLQWNKDYWMAMQEEEKVFIKKVVADRGSILSEDGTILATSVPFYRLALDPSMIDTFKWDNFSDSLRSLSANLTNLFDQPENDSLFQIASDSYYQKVMKALAEGDRHVYLNLNKINFRQLEIVQTWPILNRGRWESGFIAELFNNERYYPFGELAKITLGTLVDDTVGVRGLEHSYNRDLRGEDGYILAQKVVGGSYVPLDQYGKEASLDGYDIVTTLDISMQEVVEEALRDGVEKNFAKYGTAILIEVETGKIKALANYPETYNHAIATRIEPGSTFKIASAAALLEDFRMDVCDTIDTGNGRMMYDDKEITDNGHAYGRITLEQIIAYSSNVGISIAINENYAKEPQVYLDHLRDFGFYEPANRDIAGEPYPVIFNPDEPDWTMATLPSMSYGYSIGVTPIQMAAFYNGIANRGRLMRPWMVSEIKNNTQTIRRNGPEVMNENMVTPQTALQIRDMMMGTVEYGTAVRQFRGLPFLVAGKTGTAKKNVNGRYVKEYRASFGGFFPADAPRYTLYIMVDEPRGTAASGGTVAAPIFRKIAEQIYAMDREMATPPELPDQVDTTRLWPQGVLYASVALNMHPEINIRADLDQASVTWVTLGEDSTGKFWQPLDLSEQKVPDLRGMSSRDALNLLENMGLRVRLQGVGRVKRQSLMPGHRAREGGEITLFLG
ncbi:MAG: transpeptidase family protein [Bacteroidia bacterium]|nr:transpeptidase family protein [Bacteroidia bacterium]